MNYRHEPLADILGKLLADKADIGTEIESVKATLIGEASMNPGIVAFEGDLFRATVSFTTKKVVDYKAVLAHLVEQYPDLHQEAVDRAVKHFTARAEGVPMVRCTARKGV